MDTLNERFQKFSSSVYAVMYRDCADMLGVDVGAVERLPLGFDYKYQAWVAPERNSRGDIIGISYRYANDSKTMAPGYKNKRGLTYPMNQDYGTGTNRYAPGKHNFTRVADAGINCPVCGKPDGCLVSSDNLEHPAAAICIRPQGKEGATTDLGDAGYLHVFNKNGRVTKQSQLVLPETDLPILIVEGASDVLAAMSLGFVAIGRPNAKGCSMLTTMPLSGKELWIIGENDAGAGREGMEAAFAAIHKMTPVVKKVMPPDGIKDLRAWYRNGLSQRALIEYVEQHAVTSDCLDPSIFEDGQPAAIAREFVNREHSIGGLYTLRNYREDWYNWDGSRYERVPSSSVRGLIYQFLEGKKYVSETASGKSVLPVSTGRRTAYDLIDCLNMPDLCPVNKQFPCWLSKTDMPDPRRLIPFKNGILDVDEYMNGKIVLHDPSPDLFIMETFPYSFDEDAESRLIEDYFYRIFNGDDEVIKLMQQWFGYNCVPDMTQEKMMLFTGRPRSGKSTTLDILRGTLGSDQCCSLQMSHLIGRFGRAPMLGKLAAIFGDAKTPRANEANVALETLLAIIGQDAVSVDRKNVEELTSVNLFCRFTMAMNGIPAFSDHARALAPRMNIIYFPNTYVGKEDFRLKPKLSAEAKAGKLINWSLRGLKSLREQGSFIAPIASFEMTERLEQATTPTLGFVKDCCVLNAKVHTSKDMMYGAWKGWCEDQGRNPGMKEQFGRWMLNACPTIRTNRRRNDSGGRHYTFDGILLLDEAKKRFLR